MDISLSLVNSTIKVNHESSAWPRKNDCVNATITSNDCTSYTAEYLPKTQVALTAVLKDIKSKLTEREMNFLIIAINKHSEYCVDVANDENAMNNAGESL